MESGINFTSNLGSNPGIELDTPRFKVYSFGGRVTSGGGKFEADNCMYNTIKNSLFNSASLVITPNSTQEGKLYSVIPSDGSGDLSVTRATTATRVNSAGLVELVPYNLIWYSEQFDNVSYWGLEQISVTANSTTAPNGTTTADTITDSSTFGYTYQSVPISGGVGSIVTHSVFLKRTNNDWVNVAASRTPGTTYGEFGVWFNLATGSIGSNFQAGVGVVVDSEITDEGDGWYRCSVTGYVPNAVGYVPYVFNSNADNSFTSSAGKSRYQWGAQLVEGSVAKDYQKTETRLNIPRLDYSNGTCPSILVEPQRTNLVTWSSSFDNAAWQKENASVSANTTTSPDGTQNADSLIENGANDSHLIYQGGTLSAASYSASVFVKKNTRQYAFLQIATDGAANRYTIVVDLNNGTMTASSTSGSPSGTSYKIDSMGDGWYMLSVTATHTSAQVYSVFGLSNSGTPTFNSLAIPTYSGNGTSSAYFYGAQLEAGSYATSYIPTTSASVTRNADVISKTGISSLIGQTEGTIFVDFEKNIGVDAANIVFSVSDGSSNNLIYYNLEGGVVEFLASGTTQALKTNIALASGTNKIAVVYKANDFAIYLNGINIFTDTSGSVGAMSKFNLGSFFNDAFSVGTFINAAALWKTRLTNDELERLTGVGFNTYTEMANYYNYITQ